MQCFVVFVLQHGGKDLESFVLLNFDEVHSLLVQVMMNILFKHFLSILH
jgi:serine/threonine-protein kinase haspin